MFHWVFEAGVEEQPGWAVPGDPLFERRTRRFRSWRPGGRWHAACDLAVQRGTAIRAVCAGTVIECGSFYEGTWAVAILHEHPGFEPFVVRYGEVLGPEQGGTLVAHGARVRGGDEIAQVGQLAHGGQMLHFELYAGGARRPSLSIMRAFNRPPLSYTDTDRDEIMVRGWDPDFQRRGDLADPSAFLQAIKRGELPPAPSAWRPAASGLTTIDFGDDEVDALVGTLRSSAVTPRTTWHSREMRLRMPGWPNGAESHDFELDPLAHALFERHGPEDP